MEERGGSVWVRDAKHCFFVFPSLTICPFEMQSGGSGDLWSTVQCGAEPGG